MHILMENGHKVQVHTKNPNPDLKWETKSELNLGLDFSFLKK